MADPQEAGPSKEEGAARAFQRPQTTASMPEQERYIPFKYQTELKTRFNLREMELIKSVFGQDGIAYLPGLRPIRVTESTWKLSVSRTDSGAIQITSYDYPTRDANGKMVVPTQQILIDESHRITDRPGFKRYDSQKDGNSTLVGQTRDVIATPEQLMERKRESTLAATLESPPAAIAQNYQLRVLSANSFAVNPQQSPADYGSKSIGAVKNKDGGYDLRHESQFTDAKWERAALTELVGGDGLATLRRNKYNVSEERDVLKWRTADGDSGYVVFSKNPNDKEVVCICNGGEVSVFSMDRMMFGGFTMKKPVIYLYPEAPTDVEVKVLLSDDAQFISRYPAMQNEKWSVTAYPDGQLVEKGTEKRFSYLFWEAQRENGFEIDPTKAFCIPKNEVANFLEDSLIKLGLNDKERNDFIVYWLPIMEQNNFNLVQFLEEDYTKTAQLEIVPAPDSVNRVFMVFKKSSGPIKTDGYLPTTSPRNGFSVIEWGGANLDEYQNVMR